MREDETTKWEGEWDMTEGMKKGERDEVGGGKEEGERGRSHVLSSVPG